MQTKVECNMAFHPKVKSKPDFVTEIGKGTGANLIKIAKLG